MNIKKLAQIVGVSPATVSKAFSGSKEISAATRNKVFAAAKEHGCFDKYYKNKYPRTVIAIICPEIISDYYTNAIDVVSKKIRELGGICIVTLDEFRPDIKGQQYSYLSSYAGVDGIIVIGDTVGIDDTSQIPTVVLLGYDKNIGTDSVNVKIDQAMEDAIRHLKDLGHSDVAFVGERRTVSKMEWFKSAMRKVGLPLRSEWLIVNEQSRFATAGEQSARAIIAMEKRPTAIVAAYDYMAIGLIKELTKAGINVPEDISVIGMDDISVALYLQTGLSTIRIGSPEAFVKAAELIMRKVENKYFKEKEPVVFVSEYIPRQTTAHKKNKASE